MSDKINTSSIQQFIQAVKGADASNQREIRVDINQAKALSYTLALVMTRLAGDYETLLSKPTESSVSVQMDGGEWK